MLKKALHALSELERIVPRHEAMTMPDQEDITQLVKSVTQVSPLLKWMRETSDPATDLVQPGLNMLPV